MPFLLRLVGCLEGVQLDLYWLRLLLLLIIGAGELPVLDAEGAVSEVLGSDVLIGVVAMLCRVDVPVLLAAAGLGVRVPAQQVDGLAHFAFGPGPAHV